MKEILVWLIRPNEPRANWVHCSNGVLIIKKKNLAIILTSI